MTILHIALEYPPLVGGGATYVHGLACAQALHMQEAAVIVVTGGKHNTKKIVDDVKVIRRKSLAIALEHNSISATTIDDILAIIQETKPDIIHAHHTIPALLCQAISRVYPIRYVMTQHRTPEKPGSAIKSDGKGLLAELAYLGGEQGHWIAPSNFFRNRLVQAGIQYMSIHVVWPSIQAENFSFTKQRIAQLKRIFYEQHQINKNLPLIVIPVVDRPRKDVACSLRGIAKSAIPCAVVITGAPRAREKYTTFNRNPFISLVDHTGFTSNDVAQLLAIADGVILASTHEGFGLAAIEALAAGTRVYLRQSPGLEEIIEQQPCTHPFKTAGQLGSLLRQTIDVKRSESEIRNQQKDVSEVFSPERQVALHSDVYGLIQKEVLSAGGVCLRRMSGVLRLRLVRDSKGDYVLPKGHVKRGETWEMAAIREVREESGVAVAPGGRLVSDIRYVFTNEHGQEITKTVRFYAYHVAHKSTGALRPEANEDIVGAEWIDVARASTHMKFESEHAIVQQAVGILQ